MAGHSPLSRQTVAEGESAELYFAFASGSVAAADHEPEDKMAGGTGIWSADIGHNRNEPADHNAWIVRMG